MVENVAAPGVALRRVERRLRVTHLLDYRYPAQVRDVRTSLRLQPPARRGHQERLDWSLKTAPLPDVTFTRADSFGNAVHEVHIEQVQEHLTLVVVFEVRTLGGYHPDDARIVPLPIPAAPNENALFQNPTPLTGPDPTLIAAAREVASGDGTVAARAIALNRLVFARMSYKSGSTTVRTTAAEAWAGGQGVCQDFSHILIALCRECGIAARYVSGFLPGEGAMHAWVEVYDPHALGNNQPGWLALDPTHDRWVNERYVSVAAGRDYADVTPSSGTFYGKPGALSHKSRVEIVHTLESS